MLFRSILNYVIEHTHDISYITSTGSLNGQVVSRGQNMLAADWTPRRDFRVMESDAEQHAVRLHLPAGVTVRRANILITCELRLSKYEFLHAEEGLRKVARLHS